MSARIRRNCDLLKVLAQCNPRMRKAIIEAADKDLLEAITECLMNIWCETVKLTPQTAKNLVSYNDHIKFVANSRNPIGGKLFCKMMRVSCPFLTDCRVNMMVTV
jgi:gamma-glutamyl phosphate reductase